MAKNKDRKNQPRDFKAKAESQVQAKKDMHVENGEELISSENKSSHRIMDLTIESIKDNPISHGNALTKKRYKTWQHPYVNTVCLIPY